MITEWLGKINLKEDVKGVLGPEMSRAQWELAEVRSGDTGSLLLPKAAYVLLLPARFSLRLSTADVQVDSTVGKCCVAAK